MRNLPLAHSGLSARSQFGVWQMNGVQVESVSSAGRIRQLPTGYYFCLAEQSPTLSR